MRDVDADFERSDPGVTRDHGAASAKSPEETRDSWTPPRFPVPENAPTPRPERLNRNALTIAAVIMGVLVIAAVVLVPPTRPVDPASRRPLAPPATQPSYLEQPMRTGFGLPDTVAPAPFGQPSDAVRAALDSAAAANALASSRVYRDAVGGDAPERVAVDPSTDGISGGSAGVGQVSPRDHTAELQAAAYAAALAAPVVRTDALRRAVGAQDPEPGEPSTAARSPVAGLSEGRTAATEGGSAGRPAGSDRFRQFLSEVQHPGATTIRTSVASAPGRYTIQAGAVLPAILLTEVNSDLPGDVLAQVTRDVFDSQTQSTLLLPKGAKLIGKYQDQVGVGQDRLLLAWTRIMLPDGRSIALPGLPSQDVSGAGGIDGRVDHHGRRVLGSAALLSLIGAGLQLSQPGGGYGPWGAPSTGQVVAGAAGQQLAQVVSQMLQRHVDVAPTVRIAQGTPFNVFLTADLTFPGAYADDGTERR